jgi:hypothetical protein
MTDMTNKAGRYIELPEWIKLKRHVSTLNKDKNV